MKQFVYYHMCENVRQRVYINISIYVYAGMSMQMHVIIHVFQNIYIKPVNDFSPSTYNKVKFKLNYHTAHNYAHIFIYTLYDII